MANLKRRALVSLAASYASQLGQTGANFAIKILLARLISPLNWGIYTEAMMVVLVMDTLTDAGLSQHVAREKHRPYGNMLLIRLTLAVLGTIVMFLCAPLVADIFGTAKVIDPVRALSVMVLIRALASVPRVYLDRELMVHRALGPQLLGIAAMAFVSLPLAHAHYGVWALVLGTICAEVLQTVFMWFAVRKTIPLEMTFTHTKHLLHGGRYLFLISVVGFALQQGHVAITGSLLTPSEVGIFAMAFTIVTLVSQVVETAIYRVIYPLFCEYSHDRSKTYRIYQCATLVTLVIEAPIYFYLLFNSYFMVKLLLSHKWLSMAPILAALAPAQMMSKHGTFGIEILRATKRDKWLTFASVVSATTVMASGYILTKAYGLMGMVAANYITVGAIVMFIALYRIVGREFIHLVEKMAVVYVVSFVFAVIPVIILKHNTTASGLTAMAVVPLSWMLFYRLYWNSVGRPALKELEQ